MIKFIEIGGKRYQWKQILRWRKEQEKAARQPTQPTLFAVFDDSRPTTQRSAAGRYESPMLFKEN
jgi:hypothetical protein